jgi:hypothetical protein
MTIHKDAGWLDPGTRWPGSLSDHPRGHRQDQDPVRHHPRPVNDRTHLVYNLTYGPDADAAA